MEDSRRHGDAIASCLPRTAVWRALKAVAVVVLVAVLLLAGIIVFVLATSGFRT